MPPQSPFSSFSTEDQVDIQDQLTAAYNSGHLNPAQRASVGNAIRHLAQARTSLPSPGDLAPASGPSLQERIGAMIPEGAAAPLATAQKYAVDPFEKMAAAGSQAAKDMVNEAAVNYDAMRHGDFNLPSIPSGPNFTMGPVPTGPSDTKRLARQEKENPVPLGIARAGAGLIGGTLADPRQWPLLGMGSSAVRPLFARLVSSGFAAQMSRDALHSFADLNNNWDNYSPAERAEKITNLGLTSVFAAGSTVHAAGIGHPQTAVPSDLPDTTVPTPSKQFLPDEHAATNAIQNLKAGTATLADLSDNELAQLQMHPGVIAGAFGAAPGKPADMMRVQTILDRVKEEQASRQVTSPQSVTPAQSPKSVITPESPKQSIQPEYVGDTVSASSNPPAAPASASPSAAASDLARPTTPTQPEIAPMETPSKPTENTAQLKFVDTIDGRQPVPTLQDVANDWRQTAQAGPSPERQVLADMTLNPAEDIGGKVRQQMPPMPRGERRAVPRTPEEQQIQHLFGQARQELGDDATSDQIMARVEELKRPSVTPEPLPVAPPEPKTASNPAAIQATKDVTAPDIPTYEPAIRRMRDVENYGDAGAIARGHAPDKVAEARALLTSIETAPKEDLGTLYRGYEAPKGKTFKPGDTLNLPFSSFSLDPTTAKIHGSTQIRLEGPAQVFKAYEHSPLPEEQEVFSKGQFRIKSVEGNQLTVEHTNPLREADLRERGLPLAPAQPQLPKQLNARLIPNGSGESAASVEAINRLASEKAQGVQRVVVDTRSGIERPLIGSDAVDYRPKQYESVEFRGGARDGEVIDQGKNARPYQRKKALAEPLKAQITKAEPLPEPDSARIQRNLDEVNRLLEGDAAVKKVRQIRAELPAEATRLKEQIKVLQRGINSLKDKPEHAQDVATMQDQVRQLRARGKQLVKAYRNAGAQLGDNISSRYTDVTFTPERNGNLSAEGKAKAAETIRQKVEAAHAKIRSELEFQKDPVRRAQLQNWLQRDVIEVPGKGVRARATAVAGKNGAEVHIPTPEITLKTLQTLRKTLGDGKSTASLLDLVPAEQRDEVRSLGDKNSDSYDPQAYRQAITEAARNHVEGIRDNLKQQLEAAKQREASEAGRPYKPSTPTRNILRDLKAGKRTIADLSDKEIDHLLDNRGTVTQEFGPTERLGKVTENGGQVLTKNPRAEKFLERLETEKAERQKAVIEGEITPHEAMDFAQTLRDHVASKQPLSEEGHNVLAELGIDSKQAPGKIVAQLDDLMKRRAANEAGFATPGFLFDMRKLPGALWKRFVADPLLRRIGMGAKHQAVYDASPALADLFKKRDNIAHAARLEADQNVKNILGNADHSKERLAALMADANSRANLAENHNAEYQQAANDPEVQGIVQRYQNYAQELTAERSAAGFPTIEGDYLRRVYDQHMAGATGNVPYEKAVSLQDLPKQARKASAEWHYANGRHEFGPAYGTKYIAQKMTMLDRDIVARMASEGTIHPKSAPLPDEIQFNGKTYYSPEQAKLVGSKDVYGVYDPLKTTKFKVGDNVILAPKDITDVAGAVDRGGAYKPGWAKQFFQKGVIGLGFGIPHAFANVPRRIMNSFEGGMANPRAMATTLKVLFGKELRMASEAGSAEMSSNPRVAKLQQILKELVRRGAVRIENENTDTASKWMGLKFGHDLLFKPGTVGGLGGIDVRARMEYADRLITQNPQMSWHDVAEKVENQYGKYTKENWTKTQSAAAHVVAFPGWLYSSIRAGLEHPLRATVPAAAMIYAINQGLHRAGLNRTEDKDDISRIHVGNYALSPTVFSEPFAKAVSGPAMAAAQSLIRGGSTRDIANQFEGSIPRSLGKGAYAIVPYYAAPMEVAFNRQYAGTEKEIFKPGAFDRKGKTGLSEGTEAILAHLGTRIIPQVGRVAPEGQDSIDIPGFLGSQVGLPMFKQEAEGRLLRNLGITSQASHLLNNYKTQQPGNLPQLFQNEPALQVDNAFHSQFEAIQKGIKTIDDEKIAFPAQADRLEAARTVLLSAADEVNDRYQEVREQQVNAKKDKPIDKLKRAAGF